MNEETDVRLTILVVEDVEETRDGIVKLLNADGYHVEAARCERDAVDIAGRKPPDLILVSLSGLTSEVIETARGIREHSGLSENVFVVIFCIEELEEGQETDIGHHIYLTRPDNFNQLRSLIARLLRDVSKAT
jgi:DNA-binding response OmpR family regulator